jgi:hypothetical protein
LAAVSNLRLLERAAEQAERRCLIDTVAIERILGKVGRRSPWSGTADGMLRWWRPVTGSSDSGRGESTGSRRR